MAKQCKSFDVKLKVDADNNVIAEGYMIVGSSDDASLKKGVYKQFTLDATNQSKADDLFAVLQADLESDESIS